MDVMVLHTTSPASAASTEVKPADFCLSEVLAYAIRGDRRLWRARQIIAGWVLLTDLASRFYDGWDWGYFIQPDGRLIRHAFDLGQHRLILEIEVRDLRGRLLRVQPLSPRATTLTLADLRPCTVEVVKFDAAALGLGASAVDRPTTHRNPKP